MAPVVVDVVAVVALALIKVVDSSVATLAVPGIGETVRLAGFWLAFRLHQ
jgi:hypothetical protein